MVGTIVVTDPGSLGLAGEQFPIPDSLTEEDRARVEQERTTWRGTRLPRAAKSPAGNHRGSVDRLTGRPACLDCREVQDLDQSGVEDTGRGCGSGSAADQRQSLLVHPERCYGGLLYEAAHSNLDWIAPAGVPSGWVVFNTEPISAAVHGPTATRWPIGANMPRVAISAAMEEPKLLVDDSGVLPGSALTADHPDNSYLYCVWSLRRTIDADKSVLRRGWAAQGEVRRDRCGAGSGMRSTLSFRSRPCLCSSTDDRRARSRRSG